MDTGRLSFIGLTPGLPAQEAQAVQLKLFALRQKAAALNEERLTFNSEDELLADYGLLEW